MAKRVPAAKGGDLALCLQRMDYGRGFRHELGLDRKLGTPFSKPLSDAVSLFDALRIGYALIGGVAAMYYGRPRITEGVHFVAITGHEAVFAASPQKIKSFGFDPSGTRKLYHQSGVEIHIWKDGFADGVQRAATARLGEIVVRIAEVHDLLATKLRAGRFQDDYDISEILRHNEIRADLLKQRVTPEQFARFQQIAECLRNQQR